MASRLSTIFFIILCLEVGTVLTFLPWVHPFNLNEWGENTLLLYAAHKTGFVGLQHAMASGWVRGAVSGLGILNIAMAVWEMLHFNQTVSYLEGETKGRVAKKDAAQSATAGQLSHHERRDDSEQHPGQ